MVWAKKTNCSFENCNLGKITGQVENSTNITHLADLIKFWRPINCKQQQQMTFLHTQPTVQRLNLWSVFSSYFSEVTYIYNVLVKSSLYILHLFLEEIHLLISIFGVQNNLFLGFSSLFTWIHRAYTFLLGVALIQGRPVILHSFAFVQNLFSEKYDFKKKPSRRWFCAKRQAGADEFLGAGWRLGSQHLVHPGSDVTWNMLNISNKLYIILCIMQAWVTYSK